MPRINLDAGLLFSGEEIMSIKLKSLIQLSIPLLLLLTAGCATIDGAGKDIESAGEAIQDAANNE